MKKVNMETQYNTLKEMAKELGLKFVGIKREVLIENINNKIDEMEKQNKTKTSGKWYEQENAFPYNVGDIVIITSHKDNGIVGRMIEVTGLSTKRNAIKGHLISPKNGQKQKTSISLDFSDVTLHNPLYPVVVPQTSIVVA